MKPHPHPERPDRLRAIAASLAKAGIYLSKYLLFSLRFGDYQNLPLSPTTDILSISFFFDK
jgi:histone deacetylase 6